MGCVLSALGAILIIARGFPSGLVGVFLVGILLFGVGLIWK
jgi:hypothetical protein